MSTGSEGSRFGGDERLGHPQFRVRPRPESRLQTSGLPGRSGTVPLLRFTTGTAFTEMDLLLNSNASFEAHTFDKEYCQFCGMGHTTSVLQ